MAKVLMINEKVRVLAPFSPTFPGFCLYHPSRHDQPTKLKALIEYTRRRRS